MQRLNLLQDAFCGGRGGSGGGGGGPGLLVFLGLRLQPFPLFFLLFPVEGSGTGE